ncbi:MAG: LpxL/LpxP family Kdo(2)-lipid IV(A) lauroyl/palmitoleoyl acyltransferase [Gammaproteobacteria bacterium]|nr:MAG: LpxL/LpxP family Kdo(2)-lipid IV(A) lauroyl/palmitoleoyl acyltransferase [Gammaproteobacteria bacterium]TDJ32472.1 MAG: LpxL/LpxP family Kdo(2)-lipid IV(A) lauroyl/palmitoleoyl acyltransferase [Gammaproteobacteria bacterium]
MSKRKPRPHIYSPRVWGTWLAVGFAWLLTHLPLRVMVALSKGFGRVFYHLAHHRRHVAEINLKLCFPELSDEARKQMVKNVFIHVAVGAVEVMVPWLNPNRNVHDRCTVTGVEHLEAAQAMGRGVILVGGHFAVMDIISHALSEAVDIDVMYRENKDPVWEWLQVMGRSRFFDGVIEREDARQTLRRLKAGRTIWYAADQDYGRKHSVFAPFFGVATASITATSRFARFNKSPVLFMSHFRDLDTLTWSINISPIIEGFPTDDDVADATRMNAILEAVIRQHPEQYLWIHRRFKTRPEGEPYLY